MQKLSEFFEKKISLSQMIQNCLIRREIAKKKSAADGGFRQQLRYCRRFFQFSVWQHSILRIFFLKIRSLNIMYLGFY